MASYIFSDMDAADVAALQGGDDITFSGRTRLSDVRIEFISGPLAGTGDDQIKISVGNTSLLFDHADIEDVSFGFERYPDIAISGGTLGSDTISLDPDTADARQVLLGLDGDDAIDASDYLGVVTIYGGADDDVITGGAQGDHLYGYGTANPLPDGEDADTFDYEDDDSIDGGGGNDYIHGNAGDDTLSGGDGRDKIRGGRGDDRIDGGDHNDSINGNKGDDTIEGGQGNDSVSGGQGNDEVHGDDGHDIVTGDLGDDTLFGGLGLDRLSGGRGADVFVFEAGDSTYGDREFPTLTDIITDFMPGEDKIRIDGFDPADHRLIIAGSTATSLRGAETIAQALFDARGDSDPAVVVVDVQGDSYLFFASDPAAGDLDNAIRLLGVLASQLSSDAFEPAAGPPSISLYIGTASDDVITSNGVAPEITIVGGTGHDELYASTPGMSAETFVFYRGDNLVPPGSPIMDTIYDFDPTEDKILFTLETDFTQFSNIDPVFFDPTAAADATGAFDLSTTARTVVIGRPAVVFIEVGNDTYVLYSDIFDSNLVNSVIKLVDVDASSLSLNNFIATV